MSRFVPFIRFLRFVRSAALLSAALLALLALASKAHEHGSARLDIAVEAQRITLQFESPLENLVGFERAPRTAAERQAVQAMLARLRDPATLLRIDAAAGCRGGTVSVESGVLGLGSAKTGAGGHADLQAEIVFDCQDAARSATAETELFAAFARLQRIQVQLVLPRGQRSITLRRPVSRIELRR